MAFHPFREIRQIARKYLRHLNRKVKERQHGLCGVSSCMIKDVIILCNEFSPSYSLDRIWYVDYN